MPRPSPERLSVLPTDTITVLEGTTQHKIRFYGIDCPESGQDFGGRAKRFLSDMVFCKQVQVVQKDMERYGRVVGMVYVGALPMCQSRAHQPGQCPAPNLPKTQMSYLEKQKLRLQKKTKIEIHEKKF